MPPTPSIVATTLFRRVAPGIYAALLACALLLATSLPVPRNPPNGAVGDRWWTVCANERRAVYQHSICRPVEARMLVTRRRWIRHAAARVGDAFVIASVLTGPFMPTEFRVREFLSARRFTKLLAGTSRLAGIAMRAVPDSNARVAAVLAGDVDMARQIPVQGVSQSPRSGPAHRLRRRASRGPDVFQPHTTTVRRVGGAPGSLTGESIAGRWPTVSWEDSPRRRQRTLSAFSHSPIPNHWLTIQPRQL
jgi:hypothetical protein